MLYVLVDELVLGDVPRIQGAHHHHLALHGAAEYHLNHVDEVLLLLEAADELGVVWCPVDTGINRFFISQSNRKRLDSLLR